MSAKVEKPPATTAGGKPTDDGDHGGSTSSNGTGSPQLHDNTTTGRWRLRQCFTVPGQPVGKGRPRFTVTGGRVRTYTPKATREFEQRVAWLCPHRPATGPIRMSITAIFRRPKAMKRRSDPPGLCWHTKKPDLDNVCKAVIDSCNGRAYEDDNQIVKIDALAFYAEKTGKPRTLVEIYEFKPTTTEQETADDETPADMAPGPTGSDTCRSR